MDLSHTERIVTFFIYSIYPCIPLFIHLFQCHDINNMLYLYAIVPYNNQAHIRVLFYYISHVLQVFYHQILSFNNI